MNNKIINLGGYGGCNLTTVIRKFNQPAFPFDWNSTNQNFIINCINSKGNYFFDFNNDSLLVESNVLMSPNYDAFSIHDFNNLQIERINVINKYSRRLQRLFDTLNSNQNILFCRHTIDQNPYNDYHMSSWQRFPFKVIYDSYTLWENFINSLNNPKIKLILITNNPTIISNHPNIFICHQKNNYDNWSDISYAYIKNIITNYY